VDEIDSAVEKTKNMKFKLPWGDISYKESNNSKIKFLKNVRKKV